jgi:protein involved in polysaccharide export with SLBB domain
MAMTYPPRAIQENKGYCRGQTWAGAEARPTEKDFSGNRKPDSRNRQPSRNWEPGTRNSFPSRMNRIMRLGVLLALAALLAACAGPDRVARVTFVEPEPPPPGPVTEEPYRLGVGDGLAIKFLLNPELNTETTIRPDGKVVVPLVGEIAAAGLTLDELHQRLSRALQEVVKRTKFGEVLKEGDYFDLRFVYNPELNIGVRIPADGIVSLPVIGDIKAIGKRPEEFRRELVQIYSRHIKKPDIALLVGDNTARKVQAEPRYLAVALTRAAVQEIFVGGEITSPRVVKLDGRLTALQAIMRAGGPKDTADLSRVVILRRGQFERPEWIQTNLAAPIKGHSIQNDLVLRGGDVVVVPKTGIAKLNQYVKEYIRDLLPIPGSFGVSLNYYIEYPVANP